MRSPPRCWRRQSSPPDKLAGGPSRLTELTASERSARWHTALVWVFLVGGVGLLALLAYRVWREAR